LRTPCEAVRPQRSTPTSGRESTLERTFLRTTKFKISFTTSRRLLGRLGGQRRAVPHPRGRSIHPTRPLLGAGAPETAHQALAVDSVVAIEGPGLGPAPFRTWEMRFWEGRRRRCRPLHSERRSFRRDRRCHKTYGYRCTEPQPRLTLTGAPTKFVGAPVNVTEVVAPYNGSHRFYANVGHGALSEFPIAAVNVAFGVLPENSDPTFSRRRHRAGREARRISLGQALRRQPTCKTGTPIADLMAGSGVALLSSARQDRARVFGFSDGVPGRQDRQRRRARG